ncbi:MAG: acyl-CoA dehydratase activase [bacterium]
MAFIGIDLGSRTAKYVILDQNNGIVEFKVMTGGVNPLKKLRRALQKEGNEGANEGAADEKGHAEKDGANKDRAEKDCQHTVATGYGRRMAHGNLAGRTITEIKAFALGAHYLHPQARMVIDIGGQDTKVIALAGNGSFEDFAINDRCAAGTGKFLEVMAHSFEIEIAEFGSFALMAKSFIKINSMCTVFAESEVISLLAKGEDPHTIALGIHQSIVERIEPMVNRVGLRHPILFAGGGALNPCLAMLLGKKLGRKLIVPENPQMVGALGAAVHASRRDRIGE